MNATVVYNNGRGIIASDEGKFTSLSDGFLNLKVIIIIIIIIIKIITYLFHEVLRANVCKNRATGGHSQKLNFAHILSIHTH